jgi:hypothetical protein
MAKVQITQRCTSCQWRQILGGPPGGSRRDSGIVAGAEEDAHKGPLQQPRADAHPFVIDGPQVWQQAPSRYTSINAASNSARVRTLSHCASLLQSGVVPSGLSLLRFY